MAQAQRDIVFDLISDQISKFLYYDRKEDEELPVGAIEQMVARGDISTEEIVDAFASRLRGHLAPRKGG